MSRKEMDEILTQQCYRESPYGKRFAAYNLGMAPKDSPMAKFTLKDESAFHCNVNSKEKEAVSQGVMFNFEVEGKFEMHWFKAWHRGIRLLPDPFAPASELVIVENSSAVNLLNNIDYYSSFICDGMSRLQASLVNSLCRQIKTMVCQQLTVPVAFLLSLSSTDVLGLMHERTGHANKRSLI